MPTLFITNICMTLSDVGKSTLIQERLLQAAGYTSQFILLLHERNDKNMPSLKRRKAGMLLVSIVPAPIFYIGLYVKSKSLDGPKLGGFPGRAGSHLYRRANTIYVISAICCWGLLSVEAHIVRTCGSCCIHRGRAVQPDRLGGGRIDQGELHIFRLHLKSRGRSFSVHIFAELKFCASQLM